MPLAPPPAERAFQGGTDVPLGLAHAHGGQYFSQGILGQLGCGPDRLHLLGRLDRPEALHQLGRRHDAAAGESRDALRVLHRHRLRLDADRALRQAREHP